MSELSLMRGGAMDWVARPATAGSRPCGRLATSATADCAGRGTHRSNARPTALAVAPIGATHGRLRWPWHPEDGLHSRATPRRGGILLETVIALSLFVGAAAFVLGATRNIIHAVDHSRLRLEAADVARSKMAELEAGIITLGDLRGELDRLQIGSQHKATQVDSPGSLRSPGSARRWSLDVKTRRTEFTGLSLVELTVREITSNTRGAGQDEPGVSCTLRQLVALRHVDAPEYESDTLTEGLPKDQSPPAPPPATEDRP